MPRALLVAAPVAALVLVLALAEARADVPPKGPYAAVAADVMDFLMSDVGEGGIRTNGGAADGYAVPPYFYHYAIYDDNGLWSAVNGYPFHRSVSFPAYTMSVAIDAFLDWWRFSGDPRAVARARACADWLLDHLTPPGDLYGGMPYSVQTDGVMGGGWDGDAIMPDKAAMFGLRLLRLHDTTGEPAYREAALRIADSLLASQLVGGAADQGRWPFRVRPADGAVRQDYTSHLQPALRLLSEAGARTGRYAYLQAAARTWNWLLNNPANPRSPSWQRWEGFYEDQPPEMQTGKRDHYSAHEMIAELIARRPEGWEALAVAILDTASGRYLLTGEDAGLGPYVPATLEWSGWREATYAASLQYACSALRLGQALAGSPLRNPAWRERALGMAAACSWGRNTRGVADDGRMYTTLKDITRPFYNASWYEQNFNTVKYLLELMALEPTLTPAGENHLLESDRAVTGVEYAPGPGPVRYDVAGGAGRERLRLAQRPSAVRAGGAPLPPLAAPPPAGAAPAVVGCHWDEATSVLTVAHATGPVEVEFGGTGIDDRPQARPAVAVAAEGAPGGARLALAAPARVSAAVHDLRGRRVATLWAGRDLPAGTHALRWDGRDDGGRPAASGAYVLRVAAGGAAATLRIVVAR